MDITIGNKRLKDKFEWDIKNRDSKSCIQFATILIKELNLSPEFIIPVSCSILGQLIWNLRFRCLNLNEFYESTSTISKDISDNMENEIILKKDEFNEHFPTITVLNEQEILSHQDDIENQIM